MNSGERPVHIMHWAPQDWLSSPLRAQLALERNHVARLLYRELLDAVHAAGGQIRRSVIPGAVMLSAEEVDVGLVRLLESGRIVERGGFISNPRVRKDINRVVVDRKRDAERKRQEREEKDSKKTGANVRRSPPDKPGRPDVSGAPIPYPTHRPSSVPTDPTDQAVADGPGQAVGMPDDHARSVARYGGPGETEALRAEIVGLIDHLEAKTGRSRESLQTAASKTPDGRVIVNLAGCSSVRWLRVTRDRLLERKLAESAAADDRLTLSPKAQQRRETMIASVVGGLKGDGTWPPPGEKP